MKRIFHNLNISRAVPFPSGNHWSADSGNVYLPEGFEKNYSYPVLLWLEDAASAIPFHHRMLEISERNYVGIRISHPELSRLSHEQKMQGIRLALRTVSGYANLHSERIYLLGTEQAGRTALELIFAEPLNFAGFVVVDPEFPEDNFSLRNFRQLKHLRGLVLTRTPKVSGHARRCLETLHAAGLEIRQQAHAGKSQVSSSLMNRFVMQGILGSYCTTSF